jgi:hypothetical protein
MNAAQSMPFFHDSLRTDIPDANALGIRFLFEKYFFNFARA